MAQISFLSASQAKDNEVRSMFRKWLSFAVKMSDERNGNQTKDRKEKEERTVGKKRREKGRSEGGRRERKGGRKEGWLFRYTS